MDNVKKPTKTELKKLENTQFNELYDYIKDKIFDGNDDLPLSKWFVLRLKGLRDGKYIVNSKTKSYGSYSYDIILTTFKIHNITIKSCLNQQFKDDNHKVNYIMTIITSKISNIANCLVKKDKQEITHDKIQIKVFETEKNKQEYKKKSTDIVNKKLKEMWWHN